MSILFKVVLPLAIVAAIIIGVKYSHMPKPQSATTATTTTQAMTDNSAAAQAQAQAQAMAADSSNEGLDRDMVSLDAQLKSIDNDSAQVDQTFNDKPVAQTE